MPRFRDIPQFTQAANYHVDVAWDYMFGTESGWLKDMVEHFGLDLDPDFQRAHVWLEFQQIRYVEFILRGGHSSKELYFNSPNWHTADAGRLVLVDGKQRLEAVRRFMNNEIAIFGGYFRKDYTDRLDILRARFSVNINNLKTDAEVLQWYLDLNSGGVVHTEDELEKVRKMLRKIENTE